MVSCSNSQFFYCHRTTQYFCILSHTCSDTKHYSRKQNWLSGLLGQFLVHNPLTSKKMIVLLTLLFICLTFFGFGEVGLTFPLGWTVTLYQGCNYKTTSHPPVITLDKKTASTKVALRSFLQTSTTSVRILGTNLAATWCMPNLADRIH